MTDEVLNSLVKNYNELQLTRQRETPLVAGNSLVLKDLDNQISIVRSSILDNLLGLSKGLQLQLSNLQRQGSQYRANVSALPQKERVLEGIAREKSVKENLYVYLLQKREETALSKTTTSPYEQIDLATSYGPVEPNQKTIYQLAIALALLIPIGIIFIREMINDKINSRNEIEKMTSLPILGEVSHIKKIKQQVLPVLQGGIIGEQFRIVRANLAFMHKGLDKQVMLITSSSSGEGKSFISFNLAAMLAKSGKKVALLEFDLRKPAESPLSIFQEKGLSEYLTGQVYLSEIKQSLEDLPNLHIYPSGEVVSEAGDLLDSDRVASLFEQLRAQYDTIIVNTPPVGLVSDALVLGKYSNMVGYVVRQGFSPKKHLGLLNDLVSNGKFTNASIIFNGVRTGMKYGYYGYGYGKNNAYFNKKGESRKSAVWNRKKDTIAS
jgi:capsular exopolysaccharide synthesis family protein